MLHKFLYKKYMVSVIHGVRIRNCTQLHEKYPSHTSHQDTLTYLIPATVSIEAPAV